MTAKCYELTDTWWERIKGMIPRAKMGWSPKDDRMMISVMFWLARSEATQADILERYSPHQIVCSRSCK